MGKECSQRRAEGAQEVGRGVARGGLRVLRRWAGGRGEGGGGAEGAQEVGRGGGGAEGAQEVGRREGGGGGG